MMTMTTMMMWQGFFLLLLLPSSPSHPSPFLPLLTLLTLLAILLYLLLSLLYFIFPPLLPPLSSFSFSVSFRLSLLFLRLISFLFLFRLFYFSCSSSSSSFSSSSSPSSSSSSYSSSLSLNLPFPFLPHCPLIVHVNGCFSEATDETDCRLVSSATLDISRVVIVQQLDSRLAIAGILQDAGATKRGFLHSMVIRCKNKMVT